MFPLDVLINFHYSIFTDTAAGPVTPVHKPGMGRQPIIAFNDSSHHDVSIEARILYSCYIFVINLYSAMIQGRASDSRLRDPGFESCTAVLKLWASFFTLHCSTLLSCINEYQAIDSGGYVYEHPSRNICSIWLDASQRS